MIPQDLTAMRPGVALMPDWLELVSAYVLGFWTGHMVWRYWVAGPLLRWWAKHGRE